MYKDYPLAVTNFMTLRWFERGRTFLSVKKVYCVTLWWWDV